MRIMPLLLLTVALLFCGISSWAYGWFPGVVTGVVSLLALHYYDYRIGPGWRERKLFEIYSFAMVFAGWAIGLTIRAFYSGARCL